MRVFAGPNGSGKSTIIKAVREYKVKDKYLDFGIYINADDILLNLLKNKFNFSDYHIATTDGEFQKINIDRVGIRVKSGEHNVPRYKIIKRYYRSHKLLYKAVKLSYQSFFFDNSKTGEKFKLFAQLKSIKGKENWIRYDKPLFPSWFKRYYLNKII